MKQLTTEGIEKLLVRLRQPSITPSPWDRRSQPVIPGSTAHCSPFQSTAAEGRDPSSGIERRTVRRAQALWSELAGGRPLPTIEQVEPLLAPPFTQNAILFTVEGNRPPRVAFAGATLRNRIGLRKGLLRPDSSPYASVGGRMAALAMTAMEMQAPTLWDSDEPILLKGAGSASVLMRAIALPFAPTSTSRVAVTILSWRQLLSAAETEAIHAEMGNIWHKIGQ